MCGGPCWLAVAAYARGTAGPRAALRVGGRGFHSSTSQLNVSTLCGIGGALRGCIEGVFKGCQGVLGGVQGVLSFQKRLKLSCKVDECKPLVGGGCAAAAVSGGAGRSAAHGQGLTLVHFSAQP